jgi:hypothetical protein
MSPSRNGGSAPSLDWVSPGCWITLWRLAIIIKLMRSADNCRKPLLKEKRAVNDETALKELMSMARIYRTRGQADKADECLALARHIEERLTQPSSSNSNTSRGSNSAHSMQAQSTN